MSDAVLAERDRVTRLESDQKHMRNTMDKLVEISGEVSKAIHQLSDHRVQLDRSYDMLSKLNEARADHDTRLSLCENELEDLKDLPDQVAKNSTITKAGLWVAAAVVAGAIATVWALIENKLT